MREILFRGKDIAGNWHYGVPLVFTEDYVCITAPHTYNKAVIPETVGQYTGLTDKNGKKIFEGDIVKREYTLHHGETKTTRETQIGVVNFNDRGEFIANTVKGRGNWFSIGVVWKGDYIEVIGNIYDNPELLKGENNG